MKIKKQKELEWYNDRITELYSMVQALEKRLDEFPKYDKLERELRPCLFEMDNKK